ncbi:MAG: ComEA family DNA-binding protein [Halioglobus sp.]
MNKPVSLVSLFRQLFSVALLAAFVLGPLQGAHADEGAAAPPVQQVNINTADAAALAAGLKGVGQARAEEIVRYREAFGPFASPDELMEVKGIGRSTLELNRTLITLE